MTEIVPAAALRLCDVAVAHGPRAPIAAGTRGRAAQQGASAAGAAATVRPLVTAEAVQRGAAVRLGMAAWAPLTATGAVVCHVTTVVGPVVLPAATIEVAPRPLVVTAAADR